MWWWGNKAKGIETIEDLKGKTVAVSSGTSSEIILEQALARAGMTMDDINTVEMTVDGMTTAMISGQIDAAASWSPNTVTLQNALGDNYVDLGTNADFLDSAIFPSSYICTPEYAEANHDILVRFAQAPGPRLMTGALPSRGDGQVAGQGAGRPRRHHAGRSWRGRLADHHRGLRRHGCHQDGL